VSGSAAGGLVGRRALSPRVLRPLLVRFEGCGVDFSSMGSDGRLSAVSSCSVWCAETIGTDPDEDMAALPLALLDRLVDGAGGS